MLTNLLYRAANNFDSTPIDDHDIGIMVYRARGTYLQGGLFTVHNSDFRKDQKFRDAYRLGKATGSWGRQEAE